MTARNAELLRSFPWEATSLGPLAQWPDEMRGVVDAAVHSAFPICTVWGRERVQIYNDAYNAIYGTKHPASFGAPARDSWPEIWEFLGPALDEVQRSLQPLWFEGMLLPLARAGKPEECHFDFSYSPLLAKDGSFLGIMSAAIERTAEVIARRRSAFENWDFSDADPVDVLGSVAQTLGERLARNTMDARYAAVHRIHSRGELVSPALLEVGSGEGLHLHLGQIDPLASQVQSFPVSDAAGGVGYGHLLPIADGHGALLGAVAMVPDRLVAEAGHRDFCQRLAERIHAALRRANERRAELLLMRKDFSEREQLYEFLFANMEDAAVYTATGPGGIDDEVILAANPKACELSGYAAEELIGMRREALFFPLDAQLGAAVEERRRSGSFLGELILRRKDGTPRRVEISSRLLTLQGGRHRGVAIVRDASYREARDKALADRARFDAIVQLTGGIAHDFNNFLTVILGSLDALVDCTTAESPERHFADTALLGAERAAALTDQLLSYAKRRPLQVEAFRWDGFFHQVRGLLLSTLGEANRLLLDVPHDLPMSELDLSQLTSAVLNLAANARDAMPAGGTLRISARAVQHAGLARGSQQQALRPGTYVQLEVADTGSGIPQESIERVFEPFFTTKGPHSGTGLGLAMVQEFIRQCGGEIGVESGPGEGTTFRLLLPAWPAAPSGAAQGPSGPLTSS